MGTYYKNRLLIISLALAASGILTCGLAFADVLLPSGSAMVVLASIPLLGIVALGVLIAFAWTCELLDRRGWLQAPRPAESKGKTAWRVISARGPDLPTTDDFPPEPAISPLPLRPLIDYPVNLRGRLRLQAERRVSGRHGQ